MDFEDGLDIDDFMIIGPMSEEIAEEEFQRQKLEKELEQETIPIAEDDTDLSDEDEQF